MTENEMREVDDFAKTLCHYNVCGCRKLNKTCYNGCKAWEYAKRAYDACYRKVPEGAVVLTKEDEYANIIRNAETAYEEGLADARKETAREILQDFLNYCALYGCVTHSDILKKVEQYGVEVNQ